MTIENSSPDVMLAKLRYDTCEKHDSCEPCKGLRAESIAFIESQSRRIAELERQLAFAAGGIAAGSRLRDKQQPSPPNTAIDRLVDARMAWALMCKCDCEGCQQLDTALMRAFAAEPAEPAAAPTTPTGALTEAEVLLSAWAGPLPPNGDLYHKHVELARDYFERREHPQIGLSRETRDSQEETK